MTLLDEVMHRAVTMRHANPTLRFGQASFNALHEIRPDIADSIRYTGSADPYYDDNKMYDFVWALCEPIDIP